MDLIDHTKSSSYFSIVIPVYNRAELVGRAIDSCLAQDWNKFEIIVVDDGSVDNTADVVGHYADARVKLVCHNNNRGVCPARNTGVEVARGEWIIFLDSDDELVPGALRIVRSYTEQAAAEIRRFAFMYRLASGGLSPDPPLRDETWDYQKFIQRVSEMKGPSDFLNVIHKTVFNTVRYPKSKATEALFHFDFARHYLTHTCRDVVGIVHSDAQNRSMDLSVERLLSEAPDNALALNQLLVQHGPALRRWNSRLHFEYTRGLATTYFLAGRRWNGICAVWRCLLVRPSAKAIAVALIGLVGPSTLARVKIWCSQIRPGF